MMIRKPAGGNRTIRLQNLDQLAVLAEIFSQNVTTGDFIALTGGLGAGKTAFVQAFGRACGLQEKMTSPTFTLLNETPSPRFTLLHGDLYRLSAGELELYLDELEARLDDTPGVTLMEWADLAPALSYRWTWHLHLVAPDPNQPTWRDITLTPYQKPAPWLEELTL